jgi:hypothetical protein
VERVFVRKPRAVSPDGKIEKIIQRKQDLFTGEETEGMLLKFYEKSSISRLL